MPDPLSLHASTRSAGTRLRWSEAVIGLASALLLFGAGWVTCWRLPMPLAHQTPLYYVDAVAPSQLPTCTGPVLSPTPATWSESRPHFTSAIHTGQGEP
jgi:hypothetical protein